MHTYFSEFNSDYICKHCSYFVSTLTVISGVVIRNHCPSCLHSRHVDLFKAGDRLCACKALIPPIGLTLKQSRDKYTHSQGSELMLVHRCIACGTLSINRIAADDDSVKLLEILEIDISDDPALLLRCKKNGIRLLRKMDRPLVVTRLYGNANMETVEIAE